MFDPSLPYGAALVPVRNGCTAPPASAAHAALAVGMSGRRRLDFLAGRRAARRALQRAGAPDTVVGRGRDGAPVWPCGWTGSITHDGHRALAVVVRSCHRIGVDLEDLERTGSARAAARLCLSPEERDLFPTARDALCAFSAKEAVFKATAPGSTVRFWLSAIRISDRTTGMLTWSVPQIGLAGAVYVHTTARHVISLCLLPA